MIYDYNTFRSGHICFLLRFSGVPLPARVNERKQRGARVGRRVLGHETAVRQDRRGREGVGGGRRALTSGRVLSAAI